MQHTLPDLPYALDALEPVLSRQTLELHHGKHHAAYVKKLNELVAGTEFEGKPLVDVVRGASGPLFNNAAQAWNHAFYWKCLAPKASTPSSALDAAIKAHWGSLDGFKKKFAEVGVETFGSGWVWLVRQPKGELAIQSTSNAGTPLTVAGTTPLLICDVWEHAYYVDYQNRRPDYLAKFWDIVNWKYVSDIGTELPDV
jgi:superoxide dismutase, Fe-Mn family